LQYQKNKNEKVYYVTSIIICPECEGKGVISKIEKNEIEGNNSVLISACKKRYPNGSYSDDLKNICFICEGSGQIRSDVPFKDALIDTLSYLTGINEKE
jgi:predicted metal-binding protein